VAIPSPLLPLPSGSSTAGTVEIGETLEGPLRASKESRSVAIFTRHISIPGTDAIASNNIPVGSDGHWKFAALRLQLQWSSEMSDKEWVNAAKIYNDPQFVISPRNYIQRHGVPRDPEKRDGLLLKRKCIEFEKYLRCLQAAHSLHTKGTSSSSSQYAELSILLSQI